IYGICFTAQLLAFIHGGTIGRLEKTEAGYLSHTLTAEGKEDRLFGKMNTIFYGAHLHQDYVASLPSNLDSSVLAERNGFIHVYRIVLPNGSIVYGVQPHPEMSTPDNATLLVRVNEKWLREEIGDNEYNRALSVPNDADYGLSGTITNFVKMLKD
ncbi:MAG: hypothetical protein AB1567_09505, partial [bacterium]